MSVDPLYFGVTGFVFPVSVVECDYPLESDVRFGVEYSNGLLIGTLSSFGSLIGTTTLTHSPADILRAALIALGIGHTPPTTPWPIYATSEPDVPDNCITVYDTLGNEDGRTMVDGKFWKHYGFQVRVRALDAPTGYTKIDAIFRELSSLYDRGVTISTTDYLIHCISRMEQPLALGKEIPTSKRSIFVLNGFIVVKMV